MFRLAPNVDTMYHLAMKTNVMQWGNSLAVRIPKSFAQEIHLDSGTQIEMTVKGESLIIAKPKYNISELIEKITPENLHGEVETGTPLGKELW